MMQVIIISQKRNDYIFSNKLNDYIAGRVGISRFYAIIALVVIISTEKGADPVCLYHYQFRLNLKCRRGPGPGPPRSLRPWGPQLSGSI